MKQKPRLEFWQIWNMSFGFLGIQFGFALQNANVSRIFQTLGASIDELPILWVAAPLTGLLVQPIVGHMSDRTWGRLGRRRPYFLVGAVFASMALFVMPNSPVLWIAAGMLWIMDASINVSMEPFRALVGDMLPEEQRTSGFAIQGFFIGVGAVVASALPWIMSNWFDISNTAPPGAVPDSVKWSFYLGGTVFLLAILWTVLRTREYSPDELRSFAPSSGLDGQSAVAYSRPVRTYRRSGSAWILAGGALLLWIVSGDLDKQLYILAWGAVAFGFVQIATAILMTNGKADNGLCTVVNDLFHMPKAMAQLAVVQFFSWFALFAMWIYGTSAVTAHHFGTADVTSSLYNDGADWVGVLFAAYNGFAALAAMAIPFAARRLGCRGAHLMNLSLGGVGLLSFYFIDDPVWLLVPMIGVGAAWASILSLPYALLSNSLPVHKMGVYMGIFNFFIVIPQLVAASVLGLLLREFFNGHAIFGLAIGGALMMLAGVATMLVSPDAEPA